MKTFNYLLVSWSVIYLFPSAIVQGLPTNPVGGLPEQAVEPPNASKDALSSGVTDAASNVPVNQLLLANLAEIIPISALGSTLSQSILAILGENALGSSLAQSVSNVLKANELGSSLAQNVFNAFEGEILNLLNNCQEVQCVFSGKINGEFIGKYKEISQGLTNAVVTNLSDPIFIDEIKNNSINFIDGVDKITKSGLTSRQLLLKIFRAAFEKQIRALLNGENISSGDTSLNSVLLNVLLGSNNPATN